MRELFAQTFVGFAICWALSAILSTPAAAQELCSNTCMSAHDGECDDGGPNSMFGICDFATDCADCGVRTGTEMLGGCTNTCVTANDGECNDGGPGHVSTLCGLGTDCADCGERDLVPVGTAPVTEIGELGCYNTCGTARDGECDDGGPGSMYNVCTFGTDCADCGPRTGSEMYGGCSNTCATSNDQECDDGGVDSLFDLCGLGTDCADCGPRPETPVEPLTPINVTEEGPGCLNTCDTSFDGECDDAGPGSMFALCEFATDCADCGARTFTETFGGCSNSCVTSHDGECDDGGVDSLYDLCGLGTDCADCGPREEVPITPPDGTLPIPEPTPIPIPIPTTPTPTPVPSPF